jgi:hypothetical protein
MKSMAAGCYAATQNGAIAPAIDYTICYTGIEAVSGKEVIFDQVFKVGAASSIGVALTAVEVQEAAFPGTFVGISSLKPSVLTAALPAVDAWLLRWRSTTSNIPRMSRSSLDSRDARSRGYATLGSTTCDWAEIQLTYWYFIVRL